MSDSLSRRHSPLAHGSATPSASLDPEVVDSSSPWARYRDALARMRVDEFDALPALEVAHAAFDAADDDTGRGLVARTAVLAIYYGDASFVDLDRWAARARWNAAPPETLDASAQAWWLAGGLAFTYAEATTEYGAPETLVVKDALAQHVASGALDPDALLIAALTLLEYAEFQDDNVLLDRVVAELWPTLDGEAGSPLYRGRVWQRIHRCVFTIGYARGPGSKRIDAAMAEARALEIAERHDLRALRASLLVVRAFYANLSRDEATAQAALLELGRITDFRRPLAAAWYYFLCAQAAARQEDGTEALRSYGLAVEAAARSGASLGVQQTFLIGFTSALVHAGRWREAIAHYDRLAAILSGRDREIIDCRRRVAEYFGIVAEAPERAASERVALIRFLAETRWMSFGLLTPKTTSRFLADALRDGAPADYVAQVVAQRRLRAEPDHPASWPWPVRLFTLGTFRIEVDGAEVAFGARPQRKPLELLTLLVALGPQPVAVPTVVDALWPDAEGDNAKHSLEMAVLRLRRLLVHDDVLHLAAGYLSLDRTQAWVDAWAFAEDDAIAYAGSFLVGNDDPHVLARRERLRQVFVQRTSARGQALEDAGRTHDALVLYETALAQDGLVEALHRGVIRCHLALGERAAALRAYRRCRESLVASLGIEPSKATSELVLGTD